jgi:hypothetical protein
MAATSVRCLYCGEEVWTGEVRLEPQGLLNEWEYSPEGSLLQVISPPFNRKDNEEIPIKNSTIIMQS